MFLRFLERYCPPPAFNYSKLTVETPEQSLNLFRVNSEDIRRILNFARFTWLNTGELKDLQIFLLRFVAQSIQPVAGGLNWIFVFISFNSCLVSWPFDSNWKNIILQFWHGFIDICCRIISLPQRFNFCSTMHCIHGDPCRNWLV